MKATLAPDRNLGTFVLAAADNGVAIKLVSKILGHSKVSMTLDIYNGLLTEDQNQAVEFWNRRIG